MSVTGFQPFFTIYGTSFFARGQRAFKLVLKLIKSVRSRREEGEKEKRGEEGKEEEPGIN